MNKEELSNGMVRLTAPNGIKDTRNGNIYSEVECKKENVKYYTKA